MNARLTDPILRRVSDADPAPATLTDAEAERADALLARLEATPRTAATSTRLPRLPGTLKTRVAAAAAAVVAVVGAAILAPSAASAEGVLLEAANAAALQPEATGEYWYVHWQLYTTEALSGVDDGTPYAYDREIWIGRNGGILRDGMVAAIGEAVTGQFNPDDLRYDEMTGPTHFGDEAQFTWDELVALPTDPTALRAVLEARIRDHADVTNYRVYRAAADLLVETPAPPKLRRALWKVLAGLPEMTLGDPATDGLGRPGALVIADFSKEYGVSQYVVDKETGAVLEVRWLFPDNKTVAGTMTLVEQGPRDSMPEPQPPLCGPGSVPEVGC